MIIDWLKFGSALALLLVPISLFHGKDVRYLDISRDWEGHWPRILTLGLHTIDAGRAALGGWLLLTALAPLPNAHGLARYVVLLTQGTVLIVSVGLQTFVCKEPDSAHAPFTFVSGMLFGVYPPIIASFPFLLAVVAAAGMRMPAAFFPVLAVTLVPIGFLFGGKVIVLRLLLGFCATLVPWLGAVAFRRELITSYRARHSKEPS